MSGNNHLIWPLPLYYFFISLPKEMFWGPIKFDWLLQLEAHAWPYQLHASIKILHTFIPHVMIRRELAKKSEKVITSICSARKIMVLKAIQYYLPTCSVCKSPEMSHLNFTPKAIFIYSSKRSSKYLFFEMFYNETFCVFFKHCESVGRRLDQIVDQKCADNWRIGHRSMQCAQGASRACSRLLKSCGLRSWSCCCKWKVEDRYQA